MSRKGQYVNTALFILNISDNKRTEIASADATSAIINHLKTHHIIKQFLRAPLSTIHADCSILLRR